MCLSGDGNMECLVSRPYSPSRPTPHPTGFPAKQVLARAFAVVGDASRLRQMALKLVLGERVWG